MTTISDLLTPVPVVDVAVVNANLQRAQTYCAKHGLALWPHIKTHKLPEFARRQVALGAAGITCQKIGEAQVMAENGLGDIFLPYNILGAANLIRLKTLARHVRLSVTADSIAVLEGYAAGFSDSSNRLDVLIECDTGGGRCGVQDAAAALELAQWIDRSSGLNFAGLMTYPPRGRMKEVNEWLGNARDSIVGAGIPVGRISNGGSPDFQFAHQVSVATEHRPGTYIYNDRMQVDYGAASLEDCALRVYSTVVSRPVADRAVIDAGSKALTSDLSISPGYGLICEYPDATIRALNEEHGIVDLSACKERPKVGERISIIPNHVCPVSNLFDEVHLVEKDVIVETLAVQARGMVR